MGAEGGVRGPLVAIGAACLRVRPFSIACQDRDYGYKACGLRVREREDKVGFDVLNVPRTQTAVRTLGQPEVRFRAFVGRKDDDLVAGAVLRGGYVDEKGVWCLRELDDASKTTTAMPRHTTRATRRYRLSPHTIPHHCT